jgi:alpha-N-acetylglucosamine transferase
MAILSMPKATIIGMVNSTKMVEHELLATKRKLVKEQDEVESEELIKESNDNGHQQSKQEDEKTQLDVFR